MASVFRNIIFRDSDKKFIIKASFDAHLVLDLKTKFPNRKWWNNEQKTWELDVSHAKALMTWCEDNKFTIGESAKRVFSTYEVKRYEAIELPELTINIPLKMPLFPYQAQGVAYCLANNEVLIGDTQGLGKTAQAIAAVIARGALPCLVVTPAHLKYNWVDEIKMWCDKRPAIIDDKMVEHAHHHFAAPYTHFAIVNYDSLPKYFAQEEIREEPKEDGKPGKVKSYVLNGFEKNFKSIIIDEIHLTSNPKTQRYKILEKIRKEQPMSMRLGLSGTPVKNKVEEIVYVLKLIDALKKFGGQEEFNKKFLSFRRGEYGAIEVALKNQRVELKTEMRKNCYYRREKHEVLKDLPDKLRMVIKLDIDNRKEYNHALEYLRNYLTEVKKKDDAQVEKSMRAEMLVKMQELTQISARGKMKQISEWIDGLMGQDDKVVLFCHHREMGDYIHDKFPTFVRIRGGMTPEAKNDAVKKFQGDPGTMGIICSIGAASTGLTLTASSNVAFIELPWTAEKTDQCEDRCHRIGAKDTVNATYFLGNNTIDEYMWEIIQSKRSMMQSVTGADEKVEMKTMETVFQKIFNF